jgi:hypothetical protein
VDSSTVTAFPRFRAILIKLVFSAPYGDARNYQNFSDRSKGLPPSFGRKLPPFDHAQQAGRAEIMAKQTRITIETDSLLIVRAGNTSRGWCPQCGAEGEMVALANAGIVSNLERSAIEEWLNSGDLHRLAAPDGSPLICLKSFLARVQNAETS